MTFFRTGEKKGCNKRKRKGRLVHREQTGTHLAPMAERIDEQAQETPKKAIKLIERIP